MNCIAVWLIVYSQWWYAHYQPRYAHKWWYAILSWGYRLTSPYLFTIQMPPELPGGDSEIQSLQSEFKVKEYSNTLWRPWAQCCVSSSVCWNHWSLWHTFSIWVHVHSSCRAMLTSKTLPLMSGSISGVFDEFNGLMSSTAASTALDGMRTETT